MKRLIVILLALVGIGEALGAFDDPCLQADALVIQSATAYHLGDNETFGDKNRQALALCKRHPEALNNLGLYHENRGDLDQALSYYQAALDSRADYPNAWYGLGDVYRKQRQLPLALEAYLHACQKLPDARLHINELLRDQRYRVSEMGQVLNQESLRILYDPERWEALAVLARRCGIPWRASVAPVAVFRNFHFATGSAALTNEDTKQLDEIAAALVELKPHLVQLAGHTDRQPFVGQTPQESARRNLALSQDRAEHIKQALIQRGVAAGAIRVHGYGQERPLDPADNHVAYARNRRVEITVD